MAPLTADHRPQDQSPGPSVTGRTPPARPVPGTAPSSGARWVWAPVALVLTGVFVAALLVGGGGPPPPLPGLPDAGPVTGWGRPLVDLAVRLLAVLTVGQLAYAALLAPSAPTVSTARALRATTWTAAGWLLAEACALGLTASSLYAVPVTGLSPRGVRTVATELPAGRATVWVLVLLAVIVVGSAQLAGVRGPRLAGRTRTGSVVMLLVALGAVVVPGVLAGHSATADDHVPAVLTLSVHVVTASLWVGGLIGLLLHGRDRAHAVPSVRRFSALALACVLLLTASGAAAAVLVAGPPTTSWAGEGWALLLGLKTALLGILAFIGWWHRRRTLPLLAAGAPTAFVRLGAAEVALMALTITLSVALAASPAPVPPLAGTGTSPEALHPATADIEDPAPAQEPPGEDMSGHDHGELSVSILVDEDRFHVAGTVRPGQPVTVYNASRSVATLSALDGSFDARVGPRTFITFTAPEAPGDYEFVSRPEDLTVDGFADTLYVRADP